MKRYFLLIICTIFLISCGKKETIISGNIKSTSPLERLQLFDFSHAVTLPIANLGVNPNGDFSDTLKIEHDGVYLLNFKTEIYPIYLKKGSDIKLNTDSDNFAQNMKTTDNNNLFLSHFLELIKKIDQVNFSQPFSEIKKLNTQLNTQINSLKNQYHPDDQLLNWSQNLLNISLNPIFDVYIEEKPDLKKDKDIAKLKEDIKKKNNELIQEFPIYRFYFIKKNYKNFIENLADIKSFYNYLKSNQELEQISKDYLLSEMLNVESNNQEVVDFILNNTKDKSLKNNIKQLKHSIFGFNINSSFPDEFHFLTPEKKETSLLQYKGKPTFIMFYSSWVPFISEVYKPAIEELMESYKNKVNFVFINVDDTFKQFKKTAFALFPEQNAIKLYIKNGLKSEESKNMGIYSHNLPCFFILTKEGKVATEYFHDSENNDFIEKTTNKLNELTK